MRVLVVDDDRALLTNVSGWLTGSGVQVAVATTAEEGLAAAAAEVHDVIVLDVMLGQEIDGVEMCRLLRRSTVSTPILMLTALDAVPDRVRGLEAGADDYLVKPFALAELEARLRALTRRHLPDRAAILRFADIELDTAGRVARVAGRVLRLTEKEGLLLEFLLLRREIPQSQDAIYSGVWGYAEAPATNLVDVYVGRLRRKLGSAGSAASVVSHKRQGYVLGVVEPSAPPVASGEA